MIKNNVLDSVATKVSFCIQILQREKKRPSESGPFIWTKFREFPALWKDMLCKHIDVFSGGRLNQLHGDYKGALPWLMNKSRKWSEKNAEMFRQMAHLKCLGQGISNFNETLDLPYKLFLIFLALPQNPPKKKSRKANRNLTTQTRAYLVMKKKKRK